MKKQNYGVIKYNETKRMKNKIKYPKTSHNFPWGVKIPYGESCEILGYTCSENPVFEGEGKIKKKFFFGYLNPTLNFLNC